MDYDDYLKMSNDEINARVEQMQRELKVKISEWRKNHSEQLKHEINDYMFEIYFVQVEFLHQI